MESYEFWSPDERAVLYEDKLTVMTAEEYEAFLYIFGSDRQEVNFKYACPVTDI